MDACALRPAPSRDNLPFGPAQLVCLIAAIGLHLALLWLLYSNRPSVIQPPEPITLSARWAGESSKDDAPAKPAAPAQPPAIKKPAPVQQKVVKKPVPKPVPKALPKPKPAPVAKPTLITKAQPAATPPTTANNQNADSASIPAKAMRNGAGASSAPVARDARLHNPEPPYPPESRRRGEEGRVILKVLVTKEGTAGSVEVENSSGYRRLDRVARKTVSRWRFLPARENNAAIEAWSKVTIIFKLRT